jgi:hypothetical protein
MGAMLQQQQQQQQQQQAAAAGSRQQCQMYSWDMSPSTLPEGTTSSTGGHV